MKRFTFALWVAAVAINPAQAQTSVGWTAEFTVRVESTGSKPVTSAPSKASVSGTESWKTTHELRGTLPYTQKLRGAVARNQPDRSNETRYESWLARSPSGGRAAALALSWERSIQSSGRYILVDGEGAAAINRANAAKIGRIEHVRSRTEVVVDGPDGARFGGAYLQIDRVANQIRFEVPTVEMNPARTTVVEQWVARLDKAPAAGEWDRNDSRVPATRQDMRLPAQLPYPTEFVFDVPAGTLAEGREITLRQEFKAGFQDDERDASRGVVTIVLRPGVAAAAATSSTPAAAATPSTAPVATGTDSTTAASPGNPCPPAQRTATAGSSSSQVGAEVGGAVLGGGWGRSIGSAVGGVLGALGGKAQSPGWAPAPEDCPR